MAKAPRQCFVFVNSQDVIRQPFSRLFADPRQLSKLFDQMSNGLLVEYRVRIPLMGWLVGVSERKHIEPGRYFVDEQKIGPYRFWYHEHRIEPCGEKVKVIDHVSYEVPFGFIGRIAHSLFIRPTLERIFRHREKMFKDLLL